MIRTTLAGLANRYEANKRRPEVAHFCDLYEAILPRNWPCRLLEIGVQAGGSIRMWREWLGSTARIGGIDTDPIPACGLAWSWQGSQADPAILRLVAEREWDAIIDDGSHRPADQAATLDALWHSVAPSGWYVIEDTHTSYWREFGEGRITDWLGARVFHDLHAAAMASERADQAKRAPVTLAWLRTVLAMPGIVALQKEATP